MDRGWIDARMMGGWCVGGWIDTPVCESAWCGERHAGFCHKNLVEILTFLLPSCVTLDKSPDFSFSIRSVVIVCRVAMKIEKGHIHGSALYINLNYHYCLLRTIHVI